MFNHFKRERKSYCLKVNGLTVSYGSRRVISNLHFTVKRRSVFGVIGLSGSGKSSLLKAIMGLVRFSGFIDYSGSIGYCPQDNAFFSDLTILENVKLFGNLSGTPLSVAVKRAKSLMKELLIDLPFSTVAGELSGGQQKRLNIILSLLNNPNIIILDEPFAGLDYVTRLLLWGFIKRLRRDGKTVILSTHLLNEAQEFCNNLLIISGGKRFALGSISDLKRSLKFEQFVSLRFSYLNSVLSERIRHYCSVRGFKVISLSERFGSFGLPGVDERNNFISMIKRLGVKFKVEEFRVPSLNELLMVSNND